MSTATGIPARKVLAALCAALVAGGGATAAYATDADAEDAGVLPGNKRVFEIYGFAETDVIHDTNRVDPNWNDAFRPSKIGINDQYGNTGETSISVKQSRFGVKGVMPTSDNLPPIDFKFEFDLFGVGVDAGQTTFRLRHVYGEWGQVLAGQTNSLFMDVDVFPNVIDYWGPSGLVFLRNPQVRWTPYRTDAMQFAVALEKPGNDIDAGNTRTDAGFPVPILDNVTNNEPWPDLTAQWRYNGSWGHVQASGILRDVGYQFTVPPANNYQSGSKTGWGVNLASGIRTFGKDQLLLQAVYGKGIASYMNDGGMDLAPETNSCAISAVCTLQAETVPLTGISAYYDHYWTPKWSTSFGYSFTRVDNTNYQTPETFHEGEYASVNLLAYPAENVMIGGEVLWGERINNDGRAGTDVRVQFSVKYNFSVKL